MIDLPLAMLVRAGIGPFIAFAAEFEVMRRDVLYAREFGMDIVVIGILREEGDVDVEPTSELVALAKPMRVTFHRAFDAAADQNQALADVIQTGAARILTSGASFTALQGASPSPACSRQRKAGWPWCSAEELIAQPYVRRLPLRRQERCTLHYGTV
jgi:copper homeostasis protein